MNNSRNEQYKGPELLAPAGDFQAFLGAINAGADAVYLAGNMYGARAYAKNLTEEEILSALDYAHIHGRKIYLTVNTLTKDGEGEGLKDYLSPFYFAGLDGVIVQDIGVMCYLREVFPDLPIHVSTQATVSSVYGAKFYKEFGATRVVPARELTLPEIKEIVNLGIETECFIHGSMCYSYSGQCLFSSYLGGRSGNRGRCAGPCRQPYCLKERAKDAYILSLKDMCTLEILPELIDAGITSFKIEGRMKSPSYAAGVTAIYRKYIDRYLSNPCAKYKVEEQDLRDLKNLYLRTDLQRGYYEKNHDKNMVSISSPSYNKTDEELSAKLTELYCRKKEPVTIPAKISFVTGEKAKLTFEFKGKTYEIEGDEVLEAQKAPLSKDDLVKRFAKSSEGMFAFDAEINVSEDAFLPVGAINALRRQGEELLISHIRDEFDTRRINDNSQFAVKSDLKADAKTSGAEAKALTKPNSANGTGFRIFATTPEQAGAAREFINSYEADHPKNSDNKSASFYLVIPANLYSTTRQIPGTCLSLPFVLRSANTERLRETILRAEEDSNIKGYYVNQTDSFQLLKDLNVKKDIYGDLNLYVMNSRSAGLCQKLLNGYTIAPECSKNELSGVTAGELFFYGRVPLMQSANCVKLTTNSCNHTEEFVEITDRLRARFPIYSHCSENICYNTIYNSVPLSLHKHAGTVLSAGIKTFQLRFTTESPKEMTKILSYLSNVILEGEKSEAFYDYTNGHFVKGVL